MMIKIILSEDQVAGRMVLLSGKRVYKVLTIEKAISNQPTGIQQQIAAIFI